MTRVLVVATSRKTRGGITSVIKAHETGEQWKKYHCRWVQTHRDGNLLVKFVYALWSFVQYVFILPFYDIVHIHIGEAPSALRKQIFMFLAKVFRKRTIVHFHSFSSATTIKGRWAFLYKYLFTKANIIIVLSEYWKKEILLFIGEENSDKVRIVYNPVTSHRDECSVLKVKSDKMKSILFAGTLSERKGYADMMKAFSKIAKDFPDWKIIFAGNDEPGHSGDAAKLAAKLELKEQCVLLGWISGLDKDRAFSEASVFCLPSYAEGFPMGVLDAWGYGLPVITTPVGGIPDVAIDGKNMLLFSPGDIDGLAECMRKIISDEKLRKSLADESIKFANGKFNINTINKQIEDLYLELN